MNTEERKFNKRFNLELTTDEAILVRDALTDMKHLLKNSPSDRGQQLCKMAAELAKRVTTLK